MAVEKDVTVETVGDFALKGIRRPLAAHNVIAIKAVITAQSHARPKGWGFCVLNVCYWPKADMSRCLHMSAFGGKADINCRNTLWQNSIELLNV